MQKPPCAVILDIDGLGLMIYSPSVTAHLVEGVNYFSDFDVEAHNRAGDILAFCTCTPGRFHTSIEFGVPDQSTRDLYPYQLRLGIVVRDNTLCIEDVAVLFYWDARVEEDQQFEIEDGTYLVWILSRSPASGIRGDDQEVCLYFSKTDRMPDNIPAGVPSLGD